MNLMKLKKVMDTPFKVFTPFWRTAEKFYLEKIPIQKKKKYPNVQRK